jgi:hypothetical protein
MRIVMRKAVGAMLAAGWSIAVPASASFFEACEIHGAIETEPDTSQDPVGVKFELRVLSVGPFQYTDSPLTPVECSDWNGKREAVTVSLKKPYRRGTLRVGQVIVLRTVAFDAADHAGNVGTFRWIEIVDPPEHEVSIANASPNTSLERIRGR